VEVEATDDDDYDERVAAETERKDAAVA